MSMYGDNMYFIPSFDSQISFPEQDSVESNSSQSNVTNTSYYHTNNTNNTNRKSKVWNYFTTPYGIPNSKTKCYECGKEFSYSGSPSSLKYHLAHKHNINMFRDSNNNSNQLGREHRRSSSKNFQNNDNLNSQISFPSEQGNRDPSTTAPLPAINNNNNKTTIDKTVEINERSSMIENNPSQSNAPNYTNRKSKVWNYFTIPYCLSNSKDRKTKCYECKKEFSYSGSPSSLKYHLTHKHNIDISQIK